MTALQFTIFIDPHERYEALDAYHDRLTQDQIDEIADADDGARIKLEIGGGETKVTVLT